MISQVFCCYHPLSDCNLSSLEFQEFQGVVGLDDDGTLQTDMSKLPVHTVQVLASCHALVFVENKLVYFISVTAFCITITLSQHMTICIT